MIELDIITVAVSEIETAADELPQFHQDLDDLSALEASIDRFGVLVPPVVWQTKRKNGRDRWVVIDGARRLTALNRLIAYAQMEDEPYPLTSIRVCVYRGSAADARLLSAVLRLAQAPNTRADVAIATTILLDLGLRQKEVAKLAGNSQGWVSQSAKIVHGLAPEVFGRFRTDKAVTLKLALELANLKTARGQPDAAAQLRRLSEHDAAQAPAAAGEKPLRGRAAAKAKREGGATG